jgi:hypothetical protein
MRRTVFAVVVQCGCCVHDVHSCGVDLLSAQARLTGALVGWVPRTAKRSATQAMIPSSCRGGDS